MVMRRSNGDLTCCELSDGFKQGVRATCAVGGRSGRELPDVQGVLAQQPLAVLGGGEVEAFGGELEFLRHRQFPPRARVARAPDELAAAELLVDRLEEGDRIL